MTLIKERRRSRELALMVLYQMEHSRTMVDDALDTFADNFEAPPQYFAYTEELVRGIGDNKSAIDSELNQVSKRWKLDRMARVDRNILRLACQEMLHTNGEVPPKVAISEAVELAKRFGSEDSPAFVNGVLDSLLNSHFGKISKKNTSR
ncbi:transcription antitermination factor NusB [Dethiosulfatarculus sandiegensis]|uniref:Transcription antitermination protein NusB n=1 Tax=Dethiosulfatarculus sandiegensis TaxID=1429043 RepID=A0A0D2HL77_9BACT|nr:transcription antitermination factor NusB [Dethiosulfatarculus sandiegensis]KIX11388.1 transcription antitermination protein NusB [Dethiosulfatarculus sandiegensis]